MTKGKAYGRDREYQVASRDYLLHRQPSLMPYAEDGIDIPFVLPDTTWTFDVAMRDVAGKLVVAECRRTIDPVKQEDVAAFALKVESLRRSVNGPVAALFFTKTAHQLGALRVGEYYGVSTVVMGESTATQDFDIVFHNYDSERDRRIRHFILHAKPGQYKLTGFDVTLTHVRTDGSSESR